MLARDWRNHSERGVEVGWRVVAPSQNCSSGELSGFSSSFEQNFLAVRTALSV